MISHPLINKASLLIGETDFVHSSLKWFKMALIPTIVPHVLPHIHVAIQATKYQVLFDKISNILFGFFSWSMLSVDGGDSAIVLAA